MSEQVDTTLPVEYDRGEEHERDFESVADIDDVDGTEIAAGKTNIDTEGRTVAILLGDTHGDTNEHIGSDTFVRLTGEDDIPLDV